MTLKKQKGWIDKRDSRKNFLAVLLVGRVKGEARYQRKTTGSVEEKEVNVIALDNMHN